MKLLSSGCVRLKELGIPSPTVLFLKLEASFPVPLPHHPQNFKPKRTDLRQACRRVIRQSIQDNCEGKSLIGPITDLEIWPVMKHFLLMKDLPRTQTGIMKIQKYHPKLKLLCPEEEEEEEEEEEDDDRYSSEMLDELL